MASAQEGSDVATEIADEDVGEWKDNGLMLELAPFKLEKIYDYETGGLHPVHLGDVLGDAYSIIHKLGHGGFATVWLARDLKAQDTTKYVALKIIRADSSRYDCPKLLLDRRAGEIYHEGEGFKYLCFPLDRFQLDGPNGSHLCFVCHVLGPRVSYGVFRTSDDLDKILRGVCHGVTTAIASLHHQGICHGDIRPDNVLHQVTGFDGLPEEEILSILGEPRRNPVLDADDKENTMPTAPRYLVYPVGWDDVDTKFLLETPKLIDFGECFHISDPPEDVGTPGYYRSPELLLEGKFGIASDLWALAFTLFEIRTGRKLFESFDDSDDDYLEAMCLVLGRLPEPWWSTRWEARRRCFKDEADENGRAITVHESQTDVYENVHPSVPQGARSLIDKLKPGLWYMDSKDWFNKDIPEEEKSIFADLLGKLLQPRPEDRISAQAVLEHEWFSI
ncbi:Protein kinase-like domain containing protein [Rhypophila decipiens]